MVNMYIHVIYSSYTHISIYKHFCFCVWAYVCVCAQVHMCAPAGGGQRSTMKDIPQATSTSLRQGLSQAWIYQGGSTLWLAIQHLCLSPPPQHQDDKPLPPHLALPWFWRLTVDLQALRSHLLALPSLRQVSKPKLILTSVIFLTQPSECWDYSYVPPSLDQLHGLLIGMPF